MAQANCDLKRQGWQWKSEFVWRNPNGWDFDLRECSPAAMMEALREGSKERTERKLADKAEQDDGVDAEPIRAALRKKTLDPRVKAVARSIFYGALWTKEDLQNAGYSLTTECHLCGISKDTLEHRLLECLAPEAGAVRVRVDKVFLKELKDRLATSRVATQRLWPEPIAKNWPGPLGETKQVEEVAVEVWSEGKEEWQMIWGRPELNYEAVYKMLEAASTRPQTLQTFVDGAFYPHKNGNEEHEADGVWSNGTGRP